MPARIFLLLSVLLLSLSFTETRPARAGGIGDCEPNCPPFISICKGGLHAGLQCTKANEETECPKSECIDSTFTAQPPWLRVCKGGPDNRRSCTAPSAAQDPCPDGFCVLEFIPTRPAIFKGELTIVVDDQESPPLGVDPCGAATMLLELRGEDGQPHFFSQIYRCIDPKLETDAEFLRLEDELNASADAAADEEPMTSNTVSILNRLLFRPYGKDIREEPIGTAVLALRRFAGLSDTREPIPLITNARKIGRMLDHTAHGSDELASVVRFEVQIRFVPFPDQSPPLP